MIDEWKTTIKTEGVLLGELADVYSFNVEDLHIDPPFKTAQQMTFECIEKEQFCLASTRTSAST